MAWNNLQDLLNCVNSVRDNPVQLVKHMDEVPQGKLTYPCYGEVKYDGVWCGVLVLNGQALAISRTGKVFTNLDWLRIEFGRGADGLYIGELVNPEMSLEELSGAVNPNRVEPLDDERYEKLRVSSTLMLHDYVAVHAFGDGIYNMSYHNRRQLLENRAPKSPKLKLVQWEEFSTPEEFLGWADEIIALGHEGVVRKEIDAIWQAGHKGYRSTKVVRGISYDLRCVGFEHGKGKRTGQIAKLRFSFRDGKEFNADLGKGWDDDKRIELTQLAKSGGHPIGSVFKVYALQESSKGVLRLPKVGEHRIDKIEADF